MARFLGPQLDQRDLVRAVADASSRSRQHPPRAHRLRPGRREPLRRRNRSPEPVRQRPVRRRAPAVGQTRTLAACPGPRRPALRRHAETARCARRLEGVDFREGPDRRGVDQAREDGLRRRTHRGQHHARRQRRVPPRHLARQQPAPDRRQRHTRQTRRRARRPMVARGRYRRSHGREGDALPERHTPRRADRRSGRRRRRRQPRLRPPAVRHRLRRPGRLSH